MRPIQRGNWPIDENGNEIQFKHYKDALKYLSCLGDYCSYCEIWLTNPAIEHIQPKSLQPAQINCWDNFLLACTACNSTKGTTDINLTNLNDYFWPHLDNTARAFVYEKYSVVQIHPALTEEQQEKAKRILSLSGLNKAIDSHKGMDRRWSMRNTAWDKAERAKNNLALQNSEAMREEIISNATSTGYWSVWMTVFAQDQDMRQRLITAFPGTCSDCFDDHTQPIKRVGGQI